MLEDPLLKDKLEVDNEKCILMNLLIKYYKRYCAEGLVPPQSIVEYSKDFLDSTSPVTIWFRDNLEESTENIIKNETRSGRKRKKRPFNHPRTTLDYTTSSCDGC